MSTATIHTAPSWRYGRRVHTVGPIRGACEDWALWEPPKLSEKGRAFEPSIGKPGSTIVFETAGADGMPVRMLGEVWSDGPNRGDLWVVKDQVAYLVGGNG